MGLKKLLNKDWDKKDFVEKSATVGIYGGSIFLVYQLYSWVKVKIASGKAQAVIDLGQPPTYDEYQYGIYADGLHSAFAYWWQGGTTEDQVKAIFLKMKNDTDLMKLIQAYGKYGSLTEEIYQSLDTDDWWNGNEIEKYVNGPLRSNGVKHQF